MDKYALTNCILLDGTEAMQPRKDLAILVDQGKIQAIVPAAAVPKDYPKRDLDGQYVLPGRINLHVHLAGSGKPKKKQSDPVKAVKLVTANGFTKKLGKAMVAGYARQQLLSGVTTIRTVGGILDFDSRAYAVTCPEEAQQRVKDIAATKADLIKLMITGGVLDAVKKGEPGVLKMDPAIIRAACDQAHALGLTVAAHVESPEGVKAALENGVDTIEHGAKPDAEMLELFRTHGASLVTTISPPLSYALFDQSLRHGADKQK